MKKMCDLMQSELEDMKSFIEDGDLIDEDELEELRKESKSIFVDSVKLAKVFIKCYDYFYVCLKAFKDKPYYNKLRDYLNGFRNQELRSKLEDYGDGKEFGDNYIFQNIKRIINIDRDRRIDLILMFSYVFLEGE